MNGATQIDYWICVILFKSEFKSFKKAIQKLNLVNWKQGDSSVIGPFFGRRTFVYDINEVD